MASETTDKIEVKVETSLTFNSGELSIGPSLKAGSAASELESSEFSEIKECGSGRSEEGSGWLESEMESEMNSESEVGLELEGIMEEEVGVEMIEVVWLVTKVW